ncbi:MAG TPA: DUF4255 domain-containing protein [Thermoanaerobaculia bacterium]
MSDYRAIGAVSASIRDLLIAKMEQGVSVSIAPPDVEVQQIGAGRINLFLYKVEENVALKNADLPGLGNPGAYGRPPLSLDLHYMVTAYGETEEEQVATHHILGDAMRVLHDNAILFPPELSPELRNEVEHVKLYLEPLSLEELSKIWTSVTRPLRLSACYHVSVVRIESRNVRKYARPVGEPPAGGPRVRAVTFRAPRIEQVFVIRKGDVTNRERPVAYARIGDRLVLRGTDFTSVVEGMRVLLGNADATASVLKVEPHRVEVTIPDDAGLVAGPTRVVVQTDLLIGEPETPHRGFSSNVAAFVLIPEITALNLDANADPQTLEIVGTRLFDEELETIVIVGNEIIAFNNNSVLTPASLLFELPALAAGAYDVRVRVNGAESLDEKSVVIP